MFRFGWFSIVSPVQWLGESAIEVIDERQKLLFEIVCTGETAMTNDPAADDSKDRLDLVEPGTVFGDEHETNPMSRVGEKLAARFDASKNSAPPFLVAEGDFINSK